MTGLSSSKGFKQEAQPSKDLMAEPLQSDLDHFPVATEEETEAHRVEIQGQP